VLRKQVANVAAAQAAQQQAAAAPASAEQIKTEASTPQTGTAQEGGDSKAAKEETPAPQSAGPNAPGGQESGEGGGGEGTMTTPQSATAPAQGGEAQAASTPASAPPSSAPQAPGDANARKQPWENVEEILSALKTGFPLLALSMETMVDQIIQRLKPTADDDMYRLISALLNDAVQVRLDGARWHVVCPETGLNVLSAQNWMSKVVQNENWTLPKMMEANLSRLAEGMNHQSHIKYKGAFEQDFIKTKPNLLELIARFRDWRDKLEHLLDSRPRRQHLEQYSHYLIEFEHQKFADIEVPGQYLLVSYGI